jgi:hypothetical protein
LDKENEMNGGRKLRIFQKMKKGTRIELIKTKRNVS